MNELPYFRRIYTTDIISAIRKQVPKNEHEKGIVYFLTGENEGAVIRQQMLDKYLEVGFRHDAIDADLEARLREIDFDMFFQARNELQAAYYFERVLNLKIQFRPEGGKRSVGEFEILRDNGERVFVEVKSPVRRWTGDAFYGNEEDAILGSLNQARKQLPKDGRPTLVVLSADLRVPLACVKESGLLFALYGGTTTPRGNSVLLPEHPELSQYKHYKGEHFLNRSKNTRVSAVATLEDLITSPLLNSIARNFMDGKSPIQMDAPMNEFKFHFQVLHNPYAAVSLDSGIFSGYPQLIEKGLAHELEWTPPIA